MQRKTFDEFFSLMNLCFIFREYADEAMKQGKIFSGVAREKFDEVAAETIKSNFKKFFKYRNLSFILSSQVPKNLPLKPLKQLVNTLLKPVICYKRKFP
jgi:hypothetical protein